ncbi:hypothetical protein [Xanthomonas dyei]|uniref:hypothetical protein n=1 Tax=Xanthomonas dyei TaxID=743699 RepID=UPI001EE7C7C8|nr:hypothetical protein [Xanthomonas dyei]
MQGVLDTGVYAADLERACAFYTRLLGLDPMHRDARMPAYASALGQVLLLILAGKYLEHGYMTRRDDSTAQQ